MNFKTQIMVDDMINSIIEQRLCIFCGSGATADVNNITWSDLLKAELNLLPDSYNTDYYRVAKYYELNFGREKLVNNVIKMLNKSSNSKHISKLIQLPILEFWTTNFDTIIEDMIISKYGKANVVYNKHNLFQINEEHTIYKMNGTIKDSHSLILTTDDYSQYFKTQEPLVNCLKNKLITKSFLFVGYSFNDNLILKCLDDINNANLPQSHYHYRFVKYNIEKEPLLLNEQKYFENTYKIKTIYVNDYNEIDDIIDYIKSKLDLKNVFISGSFYELDSKEKDRANMICNKLTSELIKKGYIIHTGNGRNLGSYIISNVAINSINNNFRMNDKLKIKQLISHDFFKVKNQKKKEHKKTINLMLNDCGIIIFLYGQYKDNRISQGVLAEYTEAKKRNMILIPIPSTNYAARYLFNNEIKDKQMNYIIKFKDELINAYSPEDIINVILKILEYVETNKL